MIRLENSTDGHNKFYEIYYSGGKTVTIRYGAIDTPGTIVKKNFSTPEEAWQWQWDQKRSKLADGYRTFVKDTGKYWESMYNLAYKKLESIRAAVIQ